MHFKQRNDKSDWCLFSVVTDKVLKHTCWFIHNSSNLTEYVITSGPKHIEILPILISSNLSVNEIR